MKTFEIVDERFVALPGTNILAVAREVMFHLAAEGFEGRRNSGTTLVFNDHHIFVRQGSDPADLAEKYMLQTEIARLRRQLETANA